jgi:hypothetical protein
MAQGTKYVIFLIAFHTLMFYAGINGYVPIQGSDNPHKTFLNNATSDTLRNSVEDTKDSNVISDSFSVAFQALDGINVLTGVILSPFRSIGNSNLPDMYKTFLQTLMGFIDFIIILNFLRGFDF